MISKHTSMLVIRITLRISQHSGMLPKAIIFRRGATARVPHLAKNETAFLVHCVSNEQTASDTKIRDK